MNGIVKKFSLAGDNFMPEMHLKRSPDTSPTDVSPTDSSLTDTFPTDISLTRHIPDGHFPD